MHDTLIHIIDIKGYGRREVLAEATGRDEASLEEPLGELLAAELAEELRMGLRLSAAGKERAAAFLQAQREAGDAAAMEAFYERFEPFNQQYKGAMARWQMREADGGQVPNDHSDADYDAAVLQEMFAPHAPLLAELEGLAGAWPLLNLYRQRLSRARERVAAGERRYVSGPLIESYHTVWFELHEALIRLAGRTRAAEADAGRAL